MNNSTENPRTNETTVLAAYLSFVKQCDDPARRDLTLTSTALSFLIVYGLGIPLQLSVLPANWRLSKHRSAFLLLFHIGIFDTLWLLQYVWLSIEFLIGSRIVIPFTLEAYVFRFVNFCIDAFYQVLAFNRSMAVLMPNIYSNIFSLGFTKIIIKCIWSVALAYSIYTNWLPERRPFHCSAQLGYFEPTTSIKKSLLATLPDTPFYDTIQAIDIACIYFPLLLYIAAFLKIVHNFCKKKYTKAVREPVSSMLQSDTERTQFVDLERERVRLYLCAILSTWPYYVSYSLYFSTRTFQIDDTVVSVLAIFWQLLGMIFHVQQPLCMLLLSKDLRWAVREDFVDFFRAIKLAIVG